MKSTTKSGLKVRASVKAGGFGGGNHNRLASQSGLKVRAGVKAGGFGGGNHNRGGLKVRSSVKAGAYVCRRNHNARLLSVR